MLAKNADLKAQIQEKVFAIAALKNDLRKLKGNSVELVDKTSVFGKPWLPSTTKTISSKKKIQERDRNSTTSVPTSARIQTTTDDRKPNPRSNNQTSRSLPVSKSSRVTITAVPKARSLKEWIPTGKLFDSCTSKVDSEPPHGSNVDIPHIHECKQTLDVSAGTSINVQKEQSLDLSAEVHQAAETVTTSNELDVLFGPLFDEYFNGENQVVLKSSAVTTTDASDKRQQQPDSTSSTSKESTLATTVLCL
ncbi:hypothetical protein Tco_0804949 [Tanacetum coccineum]